jgi:hypothetical protein
MANAPIPKHGGSSTGCDGRQFLKHSCPPIGVNPSFIFLVIFVVFSNGVVFAQSANYDIAGSLRYDFFHEGKAIRSTTNEFQVKVRGKSSYISSWGIPEHGIVQVKSYEHITDGENSAFVAIFDVDEADVENNQTTTLNERFNRAAFLYKGEMPPNHIGLMGPVWLATASSSYFQKTTNYSSEMWPLYFMGNNFPDIGTNKISASVSLSKNFPPLPETIIEHANNAVFEMVNSNYVSWANMKLPAFYGAGYTNALLSVLEWTNIGHLTLPKRFNMMGFSPKSGGKSPKDLAIQVAYHGYIETVALAASENISVPLQFQKWTKIHDFRYGLTNGQPFIYTSESGQLLAENELRGGLHIQRKNERAQAISRSGGYILPKSVFFAVLTITAVVSIYLIKKGVR